MSFEAVDSRILSFDSDWSYAHHKRLTWPEETFIRLADWRKATPIDNCAWCGLGLFQKAAICAKYRVSDLDEEDKLGYWTRFFCQDPEPCQIRRACG